MSFSGKDILSEFPGCVETAAFFSTKDKTMVSLNWELNFIPGHLEILSILNQQAER